MIYGLWWGGSSYSPGYVDKDTEVFPNMDAAMIALTDRVGMGNVRPQPFNFADGRKEDMYTPVVGSDSTMTIWLTDPRRMVDPYPDYLIVLDDEDDAKVVPA